MNKFYIKNTDTSEIITLEAESYESLSRNFRTAPWELVKDSPSYELKEVKETKISQCKSYLNSTDWYIIRLADSGDVMPDEVKTKRTQARDNINLIESCTTLEEINNINTDF